VVGESCRRRGAHAGGTQGVWGAWLIGLPYASVPIGAGRACRAQESGWPVDLCSTFAGVASRRQRARTQWQQRPRAPQQIPYSGVRSGVGVGCDVTSRRVTGSAEDRFASRHELACVQTSTEQNGRRYTDQQLSSTSVYSSDHREKLLEGSLDVRWGFRGYAEPDWQHGKLLVSKQKLLAVALVLTWRSSVNRQCRVPRCTLE
jgi:hypothetical protein